jgi:Family of unknown function (DUF6314)
MTDIITNFSNVHSLKMEAFDEITSSKMQFEGIVKTIVSSEYTVIFNENGMWNNKTAATNVYRWTFIQDSQIKLEHLRFGENHPVFLVHLALNNNGIWENVQPHICSKDEYFAKLKIDKNIIELKWKISGPAKSTKIICRYT